ncbi:hemolysin family protein [Blastopirellula sp. J2-11]|uniref:hemolysin family protein n=1 Tax=Blastopirellula sp. J2-11 TaxID=2943192 RepID=UPI0021CA7DF2|nr:hemolysin family protein [Blastopirellula sp. J2-11]UUO05687.1 hemolysin family protein [Blastopirellula sp. J2-11]
MNASLLFWTSCAGAAFMILAAVTGRVLHDLSWHELEEFCDRRRQIRWFRIIHENHEDAGFAAQCLQVLGTAFFLVAGQAWLLDLGKTNSLTPAGFATDVLAVAFVLLASTVWLPWAVAEHFAPQFIYYTWRFWAVASIIFSPLAWGVRFVEGFLRRLANIPHEVVDEEEEFEDEIRTIVTEGLREGLLEEDAREMIESVIELGDIDVADVMTSRSEVDALPVETSWEDAVKFVHETGRTRIPAYHEGLDQIVGVLYVKDMLSELVKPAADRQSLRDLARKAAMVPKSMPIDELLKQFLRERNHMAIVIDEYHAVAGLITIEDILEEIVGEIVDEHDQDEEEEIVRISRDQAEVQGRAHIDDVNEELGLDLPVGDDYDTLAGMVISRLQKIPKTGDRIRIEDVEIVVIAADRRRIQKLQLTKLDPAESPST